MGVVGVWGLDRSSVISFPFLQSFGKIWFQNVACLVQRDVDIFDPRRLMCK
jgi:hypothetical protein